MNNKRNNKGFRTLLTDFLKNIKSVGMYSASNLSFWHPLVTPSEYKHQNLLQQYPEYDAYLELYLKIFKIYKHDIDDNLFNVYKDILTQKKFNNSLTERNLLYFIEFCFLITRNPENAKRIADILKSQIDNNIDDTSFTQPYYSAVYLLISDVIGEIPDDFLHFVVCNLFSLPVFENSRNKLLFSNFLPYAFERGIIEESKFTEMLEALEYVPLSGTYNNFMQVVRLKYDVKSGSLSDRYIRNYNLRLLKSFAECSTYDFAINCKFKIHDHWRGKRVVLETLDLLSNYKNLNTNIFDDTPTSTLWYIIRNLWHVENDTIEETLTPEDLSEYSEKTLLTLAFMSPSFAGLVEKVLKIPCLEEICLWNACHNNLESLEAPSYPYIRHSQNAIIDAISKKMCISIDQKKYDRIEIVWFRRIVDKMGEDLLKKLLKYFILPFPEKRSRTKEFADLILTGKMKTKDDIGKIIQKYPFYSNKEDLSSFLDTLFTYMREVLASSKAKIMKTIPHIWVFLDNTAKYLNECDIGLLLLPDHLDAFIMPRRQKLEIPNPSKRRKFDQLVIKASETPEHRLKTVVWKRGRMLKRINKEIKTSRQYKETENNVQFLNAFRDKLLDKYIARIQKNRYFKTDAWLKLKNTGFETVLRSLIFKVDQDYGLVEFDSFGMIMNSVDGEKIKLTESDVLYLCNQQQINESGKIDECAELIISKRITQPISQTFSENFEFSDLKNILKSWKQIQFSQEHFNRALRKRGWNINNIGEICKIEENGRYNIKLQVKNQSLYPLNTVFNYFENIHIYDVHHQSELKLNKVEEYLILAVLDDLHFALSNSSAEPLDYSFSKALQFFVAKYLEHCKFTDVEFDGNNLSFKLPAQKTTTTIQLDTIEPLYFDNTIETETAWAFYPHNPGNYMKDALYKLKIKLLEIYPNFKG